MAPEGTLTGSALLGALRGLIELASAPEPAARRLLATRSSSAAPARVLAALEEASGNPEAQKLGCPTPPRPFLTRPHLLRPEALCAGAALAALARDCPAAAALTVASGGVQRASAALRAFQSDSALVRSVAQLLLALASALPEAGADRIDATDALLALLQPPCSCDVEAVLLSCRALCLVVRPGDDTRRIALAVLSVLSSSTDAAVCAGCCRVLSLVALGSAEGHQRVLATQATEEVAALLAPGSGDVVALEACEALRAFLAPCAAAQALECAVARRLVAAGAFPRLFDAMRHHKRSAAVQTAGCSVLALAIPRLEESEVTPLARDAAGRLGSVLERHAGSEAACEAAARAVLAFAVSSTLAQELLTGAVAGLLGALERHRDERGGCCCASVAAIAGLCAESSPNAARLVAEEGLERMVRAGRYAGHFELSVEVCRALAVLQHSESIAAVGPRAAGSGTAAVSLACSVLQLSLPPERSVCPLEAVEMAARSLQWLFEDDGLRLAGMAGGVIPLCVAALREAFSRPATRTLLQICRALTSVVEDDNDAQAALAVEDGALELLVEVTRLGEYVSEPKLDSECMRLLLELTAQPEVVTSVLRLGGAQAVFALLRQRAGSEASCAPHSECGGKPACVRDPVLLRAAGRSSA